MEKFGTLLLECGEKTVAIVGDRWWPQTTKPEVGETRSTLYCMVCGTNAMTAEMLEVALRSRNDAPSRKGWVVNVQIITREKQ